MVKNCSKATYLVGGLKFNFHTKREPDMDYKCTGSGPEVGRKWYGSGPAVYMVEKEGCKMDKALYHYPWRFDRYAFALILRSYEVKAQTHTCRTSMGSNLGPCPINFFII